MNFLIWISLFILFLIVEILTPGTFYFFSIGMGALLAGVSTFWIKSILIQVIIFTGCSILSIIFVHFVSKKINRMSEVKTNVDALIGKTGIIGKYGLLKIDSEDWRVSCDTKLSEGDKVIVETVSGTHLEVKKI